MKSFIIGIERYLYIVQENVTEKGCLEVKLKCNQIILNKNARIVFSIDRKRTRYYSHGKAVIQFIQNVAFTLR